MAGPSATVSEITLAALTRVGAASEDVPLSAANARLAEQALDRLIDDMVLRNEAAYDKSYIPDDEKKALIDILTGDLAVTLRLPLEEQDRMRGAARDARRDSKARSQSSRDSDRVSFTNY